MQITILQLLDGARQATGLTVIIDVFRAFSTACYAVDAGAGPIHPVGTIEDAFSLRQSFPEALLVGERHEKRPEGFDFGNSPTHLLAADLQGKRIIHTTSSGTQGIVHAVNASQLITGSFVNASAIVRYIRKENPEEVSLVCMGYACEYPTDEDTLCAEYIRNELTGAASDLALWVERIRRGSGSRFFDQASQSYAPASDFDLCLKANRFDFVLKVREELPARYLEKINA